MRDQACRFRRGLLVRTGSWVGVLLALFGQGMRAGEPDPPSVEEIARCLREGYDSVRDGFVLRWRQVCRNDTFFRNVLRRDLMWRSSGHGTDMASVEVFVPSTSWGNSERTSPDASLETPPNLLQPRQAGGFSVRVFALLRLDHTRWQLLGVEYGWRGCGAPLPEKQSPVGWSNLTIDALSDLDQIVAASEKRLEELRTAAKKPSADYLSKSIPTSMVVLDDHYLSALGMCIAISEGNLVLLSPDADPWFGGAVSLDRTHGEVHHEVYWDRYGIKRVAKQFVMALPELVQRGTVVGVEGSNGERLVEVLGPGGHRLWLAERYGYQPVRWEWRCPTGDHSMGVDEFSEYRRVTEALWLPYRVRRRYEGRWYGLAEDAVVEYQVELADARAPSAEELKELFFGQVPDEKCLVKDARWLKDPRTGLPLDVEYPWVRDEEERERLREAAVARMRAIFGADQGRGIGPRWRGVFLGVVAALIMLALLLVRHRRRLSRPK